MKDYYQVLGISDKATRAEIKTAYRKLAILYHPDISKDPQADQKIKEINIAYNILNNPTRKHNYDSMITYGGNEQKESPPIPKDTTYRRPIPRKKTASGRKIFRTWMNRNYYIPGRISVIALIFCSILSVDFLLPAQTSLESIEEISVGNRGAYLSTDMRRYWLPKDTELSLAPNQQIVIRASRIFRVIYTIETLKMEKVFFTRSIYNNFIFAPIILIVLSCLERFTGWSIETKFNLAIASVFVFILCVVFLKLS